MANLLHSTIFILSISLFAFSIAEAFVQKRIYDELPVTSYNGCISTITMLTLFISSIICCFKMSWWLIIIIPLIFLFIGTPIAFIIYFIFSRIFGLGFSGIILNLIVFILNIALIISWF